MKKNTFVISAICIWLFCLASLVGIRFYKGKRPTSKEFMVKNRAIFMGLNDEEKTNIVRYDTAILRLNDDSFHLIGRDHEFEESRLVADKKISLKKIHFLIEDPILLERRYMVGEAFQTLNNAEKRCLEGRFASIIYRNGDYFLCFDSKKYSEYVLKYGTECKQCDELKKNNSNK